MVILFSFSPDRFYLFCLNNLECSFYMIYFPDKAKQYTRNNKAKKESR